MLTVFAEDTADVIDGVYVYLFIWSRGQILNKLHALLPGPRLVREELAQLYIYVSDWCGT